jgi:hypothetical protein
MLLHPTVLQSNLRSHAQLPRTSTKNAIAKLSPSYNLLELGILDLYGRTRFPYNQKGSEIWTPCNKPGDHVRIGGSSDCECASISNRRSGKHDQQIS